MRGYYFITDGNLSRAGIDADVRAAAAAGACAIQYRRKTGETAALFEEAARLKALCGSVPFLINDRLDIALAADADGVHIGQDDMPFRVARRLLGAKKIIGLTVHDPAEAREGAELGADYLGLSPIFPTQTKADAGRAAGLDLIRQIRAEVKLPLVAIGGITLANAPAVVAAGADAVCAISAVVGAADATAAMVEFGRLFAPR
jgi:thiamine-phosphate pyrophosphorylase